jgi:hypothetical protein
MGLYSDCVEPSYSATSSFLDIKTANARYVVTLVTSPSSIDY